MLKGRARKEVFDDQIFHMAVGAGGRTKQIQEEVDVGEGCVPNSKAGEKGFLPPGIAGRCGPEGGGNVRFFLISCFEYCSNFGSKIPDHETSGGRV